MFKTLIIFLFYINLCYGSNSISGSKNKTIIEADKVILEDRKKLLGLSNGS